MPAKGPAGIRVPGGEAGTSGIGAAALDDEPAADWGDGAGAGDGSCPRAGILKGPAGGDTTFDALLPEAAAISDGGTMALGAAFPAAKQGATIFSIKSKDRTEANGTGPFRPVRQYLQVGAE